MTDRFPQSTAPAPSRLEQRGRSGELTPIVLSPDAMARLFHRLRDTEPAQDSELFAYLSSHPPLEERITASGTAKGSRPVLDDEEWQDLQSICG